MDLVGTKSLLLIFLATLSFIVLIVLIKDLIIMHLIEKFHKNCSSKGKKKAKHNVK